MKIETQRFLLLVMSFWFGLFVCADFMAHDWFRLPFDLFFTWGMTRLHHDSYALR